MSSSKSKPTQNSQQKIQKKNLISTKQKSLSNELLNTKKSDELKLTKAKSKVSLTNEDLDDDLRLLRKINFHRISEPGELGDAFDKFWKLVTAGMDKPPSGSMPRNTPIDTRISEIQRRIELNQAVLQSANEQMKNINFHAERQNFTQWRDKMSFMSYSKDDVNNLSSVKALDLELDKLRERKTDRSVFLKSSPGIANFHKTMESTLTMLDKIQNSDNYGKSFKEIKSEFDLDVIKAPDLVAVISDEE